MFTSIEGNNCLLIIEVKYIRIILSPHLMHLVVYLTSIINFNYSIPFSICHNTTKRKELFLLKGTTFVYVLSSDWWIIGLTPTTSFIQPHFSSSACSKTGKWAVMYLCVRDIDFAYFCNSLLDIGTVLTVWYFFVFILLASWVHHIDSFSITIMAWLTSTEYICQERPLIYMFRLS